MGGLTIDPAFHDSPYPSIALWLSVFTIIAFGVFALLVTKRLVNARRANAVAAGLDEESATSLTGEEFITARGTANYWTVAASLYGGAVGSWVIASTADFAYWSGIIGCVMYALAAGMPLVVVTWLGDHVQRLHPDVLSLSDFCAKRFGPVTQVMVVFIAFFNMAITLTAEYTTIASLFSVFVGIGNFSVFIAALIGIVALLYTLSGGLQASLLTDRAQAGASFSLFIVLAIYLGATFRIPSEASAEIDSDPVLREQLLGTSLAGYSSIFTMPISLFTPTVFSEAVWQRVWASENPKALKKGSCIAAALVTIVVFVIGFTGILGGWAGIPDDINPNLRLFYVLQPMDEPVTIVSNVIGVIVMILTVTMSESAIDSLQNGLGATFTGALLPRLKDKSRALTIGRLIVIIVNIPLIVAGTLQLSVINLFLATNMLCTTAFFPIVLGMFSKSETQQQFEICRKEAAVIQRGASETCSAVNEPQELEQDSELERQGTGGCVTQSLLGSLNDFVPICSFLTTNIITVAYAYSSQNISVADAIVYTYYGNGYAWEYFAISLGSSIGTTFAFMLLMKVFSSIFI